MSKTITMPCGCNFVVKEEKLRAPLEKYLELGLKPPVKLDVRNVRKDCPAVWKLLADGKTKGVFQLESPLGRQWCRNLKPESLDHLSALGAILRPGVLRSIDSKTKLSLTDLFCQRKNHKLPVEYVHPALEPILKNTYGILVYQEQAMQIAQAIAGFTLQEADMLRKAIGKKLPEEMAKCKVMFRDGAAKVGIVSVEQAEEIFGWIEKSQRYSFNKSHSYAYGINGYYTAYCKAHFTVDFFTKYLCFAKEKPKPRIEIKELVQEAKAFDIEVFPPDICRMNEHFQNDGKAVYFGLGDIKNIGGAQIKKLLAAAEFAKATYGKRLDELSWYEFLVLISDKVSKTVVVNLISAGAMRCYGESRTRMLADYALWETLTPPETTWIKEKSLDKSGGVRYSKLLDALKGVAAPRKAGGGCANVKRVAYIKEQVSLLENPTSSSDDSPNWIVGTEESLLGIALTCSRVDSCDTSAVNCTCKDFLEGKKGFLILGVEVESVKEVRTKKGEKAGQKMAFVNISDNFGNVEAVCFPNVWEEQGSLLTEGNTILIEGERDAKKGSLIIKKIYQI